MIYEREQQYSGEDMTPCSKPLLFIRWIPIDEAPPPSDGSTFLVANDKGQVAPHIRGVIHNNCGSAWDWNYGESITHWMPLPNPPPSTLHGSET